MVSAKDSLGILRINPLCLPLEVFRQRGREVARAPVNADALRQTHQSRRQQCMICDVDRVAICQPCFHLLGKNGCSREAANELNSRFGALRRTAHVGDDLRSNIAVAPSNSGAAVHVGKDVGSVDTRLRAEALRGPRRRLPSGIPFWLTAMQSLQSAVSCLESRYP